MSNWEAVQLGAGCAIGTVLANVLYYVWRSRG